jgi:hypothetical protein
MPSFAKGERNLDDCGIIDNFIDYRLNSLNLGDTLGIAI